LQTFLIFVSKFSGKLKQIIFQIKKKLHQVARLPLRRLTKRQRSEQKAKN
jgi:hypothetical protein